MNLKCYKKNKMKKYLGRLTLCFSFLTSVIIVDAQGTSWALTGNGGTIDGTNFIGTTDIKPLNFKVNNQTAGRIDLSLRNSFFGYQSGNSNTTGTYNTAIGNASLYTNTTGGFNTANGYGALYNNTASYNTAFGYYALYSNTTGTGNLANGANALRNNTTGSYNLANGYASLLNNTTGSYNQANGYAALISNTTGSYNSANGYAALYNNTTGIGNFADGAYALSTNTSGSYNLATGALSLYLNTTGGYNNAIGYGALQSNTSGNQNTANGYQALLTNKTGINNTALGYSADVASGSLTNATAIGSGAIVSASNTIQLGNLSVTQVLAGTGTNATLVAGGLKITGGTLAAGKLLTSDANGIATWQSPGNSTGWALTGNSGTVDGASFIGTSDNKPLNFRVNNTSAGRVDPSLHNAYYGFQSGSANSSGTFITALGNGANVSTDGLTNATAIGNGAVVNTSNTIQLGNTSVNKVFVGTGTNATIIAGGLQITGGSLASGKVLTSDGSGVATWQSPAPSGWGLSGNSGTTDGTNFIGTTDNRPFNIRVNNSVSGRIDPTLKNTFFGYLSAFSFSNPNAISNTGFGYQSLYANTTGTYNNAIGASALAFNLDGSFNTANGSGALFNNTGGDYNTAVGYGALAGNTTGSYITTLGDQANVNGNNYSNSTAIGANSLITGSNQVVLGNSSIVNIYAEVTGITMLSDSRFKKNIKEDVPGLEFIRLLRPVTFNYDIKGFNNHIKGNTPKPEQLAHGADSAIGKGLPEMPDLKPYKEDEVAIAQKEKIEYTGLVAQEVETAAKKVGYDFSGLHKPQNDKDTYGLNYTDFVVPLIRSVQELSASKESMQSEIDNLKNQNNDLQNQLNELKVQLQGLVKSSVSSGAAILSSAKLEQNIPNPFNQTTLINYYIPETAGHAFIKVSGINGQEIKTVQLNGLGSGQLTLQTSTLASGNYTYSLYIDGSLVDTKVMVLAR
jgi:hypothetical protein